MSVSYGPECAGEQETIAWNADPFFHGTEKQTLPDSACRLAHPGMAGKPGNPDWH